MLRRQKLGIMPMWLSWSSTPGRLRLIVARPLGITSSAEWIAVIISFVFGFALDRWAYEVTILGRGENGYTRRVRRRRAYW